MSMTLDLMDKKSSQEDGERKKGVPSREKGILKIADS